MKSYAEKQEDGVAVLRIEIPLEEIPADLDSLPALRDRDELYSLCATLKGQSVYRFIRDAYQSALQETGIDPFTQPKFHILDNGGNGPLIFTARVVQKPLVELGPYKNIELPCFEESDGYAVNADREVVEMKYREAVLRRVLSAANVEVPAVLVGERVDAMLKHFEKSLKREGLTMDEYLRQSEKTADQLREQLQPLAYEMLKKELVITRIAELENITVETRELEEHLEELAQTTGTDRDQLVKAIESQGRWFYIIKEVLLEKVSDFLVQNSVFQY
jgi:FKBP-type peptidyl-prolyl cis-trans isomerase (trigger factor)